MLRDKVHICRLNFVVATFQQQVGSLGVKVVSSMDRIKKLIAASFAGGKGKRRSMPEEAASPASPANVDLEAEDQGRGSVFSPY